MYNTNTVYQHLNDDYSRFLYEKRCMWSLSGDERYIDDILRSLIDKEGLDALIRKAESVADRLVIRGIGNEYRTLKRLFPGLQFSCFTDRDPIKLAMGEVDGHRVIPLPEFYENYDDQYVLINSSAFCREIEEELRAHGIGEDHILNFGALCRCGKQYFEEEIMKPQDHEVFVDGGCYDGTTFRNFIRWCDGRYERIYSFEPDRHNYERTRNSLDRDAIRGVQLYNKGLWDKAETLHFNEEEGQGSAIADGGGTVIETVSVDMVAEGAAVSFIKLDVEGAEYEALKGAERTIRDHHPRLAVSIYHKPEDIFTLPELILSFSEDYRFYLRHYQLSRYETILYAV